jgi:hypothetical protein
MEYEFNIEMAPEEFRGEPVLAGIKDVPTLVKNYVNAERLIGKNRIALPGEKATPEELNTFYNTLGRPETPDKYDFKPVEGHPLPPDENTIKWMKETFHKRGLTASAAKGIWEDYHAFTKAETERINGMLTQEAEANAIALKTEWGQAYDKKIEAANRAMETFGGPELVKFIKSVNLHNYLPLVKAFAEVGTKLMEDSFDGHQKGGFGTLTPAQAQAEILNLQTNKEFMKQYMEASEPGHPAAVEKMRILHAMAYPEPVEGEQK